MRLAQATCAVVAYLALSGMAAPEIVGSARVINGDTLEIGAYRIRLFGVDAPTSQQRCTASGVKWNCASQAKAALSNLVDGKSIRCAPRSYDPNGRVVAVCYVGSTDINREMIRQGWALAYGEYSKIYAAAEQEAERNKAGLWMGEFEKPWDWRRAAR